MKKIIIGIGNLIRKDDGVGIRIAQEISRRDPNLEVVATGGVGIALLDNVVGYDQLIIIDSIRTKTGTPGQLYKIRLEDLKPSQRLAPSHGMNLATTVQFAQGLGYEMPEHVGIYAIEIEDNSHFGDSCSPNISEKIPSIAGQIMKEEML